MNKKVLVTGGGGGLGLAIVEKHLALGDDVWALDIKQSPGYVKLAAEDAELTFINCDISKTANVQAALADFAATVDKLD